MSQRLEADVAAGWWWSPSACWEAGAYGSQPPGSAADRSSDSLTFLSGASEKRKHQTTLYSASTGTKRRKAARNGYEKLLHNESERQRKHLFNAKLMELHDLLPNKPTRVSKRKIVEAAIDFVKQVLQERNGCTQVAKEEQSGNNAVEEMDPQSDPSPDVIHSPPERPPSLPAMNSAQTPFVDCQQPQPQPQQSAPTPIPVFLPALSNPRPPPSVVNYSNRINFADLGPTTTTRRRRKQDRRHSLPSADHPQQQSRDRQPPAEPRQIPWNEGCSPARHGLVIPRVVRRSPFVPFQRNGLSVRNGVDLLLPPRANAPAHNALTTN
ncbi:hypothetical protein QOT17_010415 [Balamuthia mandrillaris]